MAAAQLTGQHMLLHGGVPSAYDTGGETLSDETPTSGCVYVLQMRSSKHDAKYLKAPIATCLGTSGATQPPAGITVDSSGRKLAPAASGIVPAGSSRQELVPRLCLDGSVPYDNLNGHTLTPVGPSSVLLTGGRFGSKPSNMDEVSVLDCKTGTWYKVHVPAKLDSDRSKAPLATQGGPTPPLVVLQRTSVDTVLALKPSVACTPKAVRSGAVSALDTSLGSVGALAPVGVLAPKLTLDEPADVPTIANWEARVGRDNPLAVKPVHQHCSVWLAHRRALLLFGGHHSRGRFVNKTYVLQLAARTEGALLAPGPHTVDSLPPLGDAHQPGSMAYTYKTVGDTLSALLAPDTAWHFQHCTGAPPWADWHPRNANAAQKGAVPVTFPPSTGQHATAVLRRWVRLGPWAAAGNPGLDTHTSAPRSCVAALPPPPPPTHSGAHPTYALQEFLVVVGGKHKHNACLGKAFMLNLHTWVWQRIDVASHSSIPPQMAAHNLFGHITVPVPGAMQLLVLGGASVQKGHNVANCNALPQLLDISTRQLVGYPLEPHTAKGTASLPALSGRVGAAVMPVHMAGDTWDQALAPPRDMCTGAAASPSTPLFIFGGEDMAQLARGEGSETVVDAACYSVRYKGVAAGWGGSTVAHKMHTEILPIALQPHMAMLPPVSTMLPSSADQWSPSVSSQVHSAVGHASSGTQHAHCLPLQQQQAPVHQQSQVSPTTDPRSLHDPASAAGYMAYPPGVPTAGPQAALLRADPPSHLTAGQHPHDVLSAALAELRHLWQAYDTATAVVSRLAALGDTTSPVFHAQVQQQQRVINAAHGPGVALSQAANWAWALLQPKPHQQSLMGYLAGGLQASPWGVPPAAGVGSADTYTGVHGWDVTSQAPAGTGGAWSSQLSTSTTPWGVVSAEIHDTPHSSAAGSLSGSARADAEIWGEPVTPSPSYSSSSTWLGQGQPAAQGFNANAPPYEPSPQSYTNLSASQPWGNAASAFASDGLSFAGMPGVSGPVCLPPGLAHSTSMELPEGHTTHPSLEASATTAMRGATHSVHWGGVSSGFGDTFGDSAASGGKQSDGGAPTAHFGSFAF